MLMMMMMMRLMMRLMMVMLLNAYDEGGVDGDDAVDGGEHCESKLNEEGMR